MKRAPAIAWALIACSAGCNVGPDFVPPPTNAPAAFASANSTSPASAIDNTRWWQALGSPLLNEWVDAAHADNRDLVAALARIRQARAAAGIASAASAPQLDAAGSYTRTRTTEATPSPVRGLSFDTWSLGFDASWELDLFGRLAREREARTAEVQLAHAEAAALTLSLEGEVVAAYAELLGAARQRQVAEQSVAAARELLDLTTSRTRSGMGSDLETASAERLLAGARARLPSHDREWRRAAHRLAILVGRAPAEVIDALQTAPPLRAPPDIVAIGIPADVIRRRPDIDAAEQRLHAATARLGAAMAERYPRLSLTGFFGVEANHADSLLEAGSRALRVGPALRLPLFTAGSVTQQIALREAQIDEARAALEQSVLRAFEEVENAASALQQERRRHTELTAAVAAAERERGFAQQRFTAGLDAFLTVLTAEQNRLDLADQLAAASTELVRQYVALQKALGRGVAQEPATQ